jgi:hypothetical protein
VDIIVLIDFGNRVIAIYMRRGSMSSSSDIFMLLNIGGCAFVIKSSKGCANKVLDGSSCTGASRSGILQVSLPWLRRQQQPCVRW